MFPSRAQHIIPFLSHLVHIPTACHHRLCRVDQVMAEHNCKCCGLSVGWLLELHASNGYFLIFQGEVLPSLA